MADVISSVGSFIPNKAGNPEILTLGPAERAKFLAEKAASEEKALEAEAAKWKVKDKPKKKKSLKK